MERLVCKKEFNRLNSRFEVGKTYNYWTNFDGLNHIVEDHNKNRFSFSGDELLMYHHYNRPGIWEYFSTIEDWRHNQINKITFVDYISTIDGNSPSDQNSRSSVLNYSTRFRGSIRFLPTMTMGIEPVAQTYYRSIVKSTMTKNNRIRKIEKICMNNG
mgnify:CR=1 FL=1